MTSLVRRVRDLPADTLAALAFFSRLPIPAPREPFDLRRSSAAWPLAGLCIALGPALLFWAFATAGMPNLLTAIMALAAMTALTGALHEDGLADSADGLGGGRSREAKLAIMRDSRIGTFGVLTLGFAMAIKATALAAIGLRPGHAALAFICIAILSRACALWHWRAMLPARYDGLAWQAGRPDGLSMLIGGAIGVGAVFVLLVVFGWAALIGIAAALGGTVLFSRLCVRQIGGHTGDTIGAAQQIAETLAFLGLASGWSPVIWAPVSA